MVSDMHCKEYGNGCVMGCGLALVSGLWHEGEELFCLHNIAHVTYITWCDIILLV